MINAMIILLTFEMICFLLNQQMTIQEIIIYVFTYNISICFLFIDFFKGFLLLYDLLITWFYFRKMVYIYYPIYVFVYLSILVFLDMLLPSSTIFQGILIVEGFDFISLFIVGMMAVCIFYFYISFCSHKLHQDQMVKVSFLGKNCLGFIDSGNKVFYHGYPVIFISHKLLDNYSVIDQIEIETASRKETIDIIEIDKIVIQNHTLYHVYAGVIFSQEYDCILNTELLGGLL